MGQAGHGKLPGICRTRYTHYLPCTVDIRCGRLTSSLPPPPTRGCTPTVRIGSTYGHQPTGTTFYRTEPSLQGHWTFYLPLPVPGRYHYTAAGVKPLAGRRPISVAPRGTYAAYLPAGGTTLGYHALL